ncbi:radical SAM protein [Kordia sp. YSTF-M3]|uniref:Radical SAM protein n=1 Tax=Kordia aestuariivivens TaxID=2759037 RepID=A0ABR7QBP2_9FLAO|nr:4Fe-4S single cluster domain-containing protein [Kordia aestuariivivens]MBC8755985.1 radical SAM protein [Kordia aestuariivivens]
MKDTINILDLCESGTNVLGPGKRYVIWVQGCPFNCEKCTTPEGIPIRLNKLTPIKSIVESILNNHEIEGITISGGEPFLQASKLSKLLADVLQIKPELSVLVFTGYTYKRLDWAKAKDFLRYIDVLIDGQYIDKLNNGKELKGSSNQKIIFLTDKLRDEEDYFYTKGRNLEVIVEASSQTIIGIPSRQLNH